MPVDFYCRVRCILVLGFTCRLCVRGAPRLEGGTEEISKTSTGWGARRVGTARLRPAAVRKWSRTPGP
eukprot:8173686-Pyramimonas_sp.AAC.1